MGSVFISNVDDYLAPSQACVNPLFAEETNKNNDNNNNATTTTTARNNNKSSSGSNDDDGTTTTPSNGAATTVVGVVPRRKVHRRRQRQPLPPAEQQDAPFANAPSSAVTPESSTTQAAAVKASIADCLACSGCVTTAETVLLEERHNLNVLRGRAKQWKEQQQPEQQQPQQMSQQRLLASDLDDDGDAIMMEANSESLAKKENEDADNEEIDAPLSRPMVVTISPASWADLERHLQLSSSTASSLSLSAEKKKDDNDDDAIMGVTENNDCNDIHNHSTTRWAQQFTTLLHRLWCVAYVMDGNVPLQWSRVEAAREFCESWKKANDGNENDNDDDVMDATTAPTTAAAAAAAEAPLIASSCPAVVCLVEKTLPKGVSHLARTKSPMALAGAYWKRHVDTGSNNNKNENGNVFHLAIMPCHDKKLEAERPQLTSNHNSSSSSSNHAKHVDLVITTSECLQLVREGLGFVNADDDDDATTAVREALLRALPAPCLDNVPADPITLLPPRAPQSSSNVPTYISAPESRLQHVTPLANGNSAKAAATATTTPFLHGSGGYADYIFRHACHELFGIVVDAGDTSFWKPVQDKNGRQSARVAAQQRRRDYREAVLYQSAADGTLTLHPPHSFDKEDENACGYHPRLRFLIAYGMQTGQVFKPYQTAARLTHPEAEETQPEATLRYDYVEAMACPSGCPNGGGQVRVAHRETPTQTRQRVAATQQSFAALNIPRGSNGDAAVVPLSSVQRRTSFHAVAPMHFAQGAAAGVAVKDTHW